MQNAAQSTIGVIGAGYVGLVTGGCFSYFGYDVGIVESVPAKLASLQKGEMPIYEPGLGEIVENSVTAGNLAFFANQGELFKSKNPEIIFIAVQTPDRPDGSCNLDYVMQASRDVLANIQRDTVLVLKSTVPVGTARKMKEFVASLGPKHRVAVINNPEFLKEGEAVADFIRPDRVVIGGTDAWAIDKVKALYEPLLHNGHPLFVTDHETAELGKLSANLMLASRISLINQISRLAAATGADVRYVERILRSDPRIGSRYLYAGIGYGGSCFPKDVKSFIQLCKEQNIDSSMAQTVQNFNEAQKEYFLPDLRKNFPAGSQIALLGLAFKPDTDDIREAPALRLVEKLLGAGYKVQAYDPKANENFALWMEQKNLSGITLCRSSKEALQGTQAVIVATEWHEFQHLGFGPLKQFFSGKKVYDGKNIYDPAKIKQLGFEYMGVGRV